MPGQLPRQHDACQWLVVGLSPGRRFDEGAFVSEVAENVVELPARSWVPGVDVGDELVSVFGLAECQVERSGKNFGWGGRPV